MKLIASPASPYSRKVRIVLAEKHIDYEMVVDNPRDAATRVPDFNPLGKIPVLVLDDGTQVTFRPVHPTDEPSMRELHYALSQDTIYYRFMTRVQRFTHKEILNYVYIDHRRDVAIVGTVPEAHGEEIIAVGRYYLDEKTNRAEVAFTVRDEWQGRGIGHALFDGQGGVAIGQGRIDSHRGLGCERCFIVADSQG